MSDGGGDGERHEEEVDLGRGRAREIGSEDGSDSNEGRQRNRFGRER